MRLSRLSRRSNRGFTLVEIMIVVAIIALLAAIAIPNLLRARHNANEAGAIGAMRTLSTAMESFRAAQTPPTYPFSLSQLSSAVPPYVPATLTGLVGRQGYRYQYFLTSANTYVLQGMPLQRQTTGTRTFYVDQTGVIRASGTGLAGPTSPEIE